MVGIIGGLFEVPAWLLAWFYQLTGSPAISIALIALVVMAIITPLTLKSTKGMLEMQRLAPEMRRLQQEHRGDRQKLNEEMMKLYQEHKVNPMSSCLPLLAQMPIFIVMFRVLTGLTYRPSGASKPMANAVYAAIGQPLDDSLGFVPRYISGESELFRDLVGKDELNSFGIDLARSPADALAAGIGTGLIYALLVVALGAVYFLQQRMVAARAAVSPTMSPAQQKIMQYLPVVFAIFQIFFVTGLVIYYMAQALLRIAQQAYITRRFYGHDESLGRQAQRAGERARELAKSDDGGGGVIAQAKQAKRDAAAQRSDGDARPAKRGRSRQAGQPAPAPAASTSKRTTSPKNRPTPSAKGSGSRPRPSGSRPGGSRSKSGGKRRR